MSKSNIKSQGKKTSFETVIYKSDGKILKITKLSPKKRLASHPKVYIRKVSSTEKDKKTEDCVTAKIAIKDHDYVVKQNIWPKLEISPGGIIKPSTVATEPKVELYSCGKCQESFKFLYHLVEHVKNHDIQTKKKINNCDIMELRDHGYVENCEENLS